jgi:RND family efflux transporter MFP subunit
VIATPGRGAAPRALLGRVVSPQAVDLAFPQGGRVVSVEAELGEPIAQGQILARLDATSAGLAVREAQARQAEVTALLAEATRRVEIQTALVARDAAARAGLDAAEAERRRLEAAHDAATAALASARRAETDHVLRAPFDGIVAERIVVPGAHLQPGAPAFRLDGAEGLEVHADLPATLRNHVAPGDTLALRLPGTGEDLVAIVRRIGHRSVSGLSFPLITELPAGAGLQPGGVVELLLPVAPAEGILLPPGAVVAGDRDGTATIFRLAPGGDRVEALAVGVSHLDESGIRVAGGIRPGDRIVARGAAFLADGQAVRAIPGETDR